MMREYNRAGEVLRQLMQAKGVDTQTLSDNLQIDKGLLQATVAGRRKTVSTRNIIALARFFDLPMQELIDRMA